MVTIKSKPFGRCTATTSATAPGLPTCTRPMACHSRTVGAATGPTGRHPPTPFHPTGVPCPPSRRTGTGSTIRSGRAATRLTGCVDRLRRLVTLDPPPNRFHPKEGRNNRQPKVLPPFLSPVAQRSKSRNTTDKLRMCVGAPMTGLDAVGSTLFIHIYRTTTKGVCQSAILYIYRFRDPHTQYRTPFLPTM